MIKEAHEPRFYYKPKSCIARLWSEQSQNHMKSDFLQTIFRRLFEMAFGQMRISSNRPDQL